MEIGTHLKTVKIGLNIFAVHTMLQMCIIHSTLYLYLSHSPLDGTGGECQSFINKASARYLDR